MTMPQVWIPEGDDGWVRGPGQWFSEAPTLDGWYWHKPYLKATDEPDMYWLNRTDKGLIAWTMNSRQPVEEMGGWWLGPLAPPD